jgi:hypothetical protein
VVGQTAVATNVVSGVYDGCICAVINGMEIDTFIGTASTAGFRIGLAIVDCISPGAGTQPEFDDCAVYIGSQYPTAPGKGYKHGIQFGHSAGWSGVAEDGTLFYGQLVNSSPGHPQVMTVAKCFDFSYVSATAEWLNFGNVATMDGEGNAMFNSLTLGGTAGPTFTTGTVAPTSTQPVGSIYQNRNGTLGSLLYVSLGSGAWHNFM